MSLTVDQIKELLEYDPITGVFRWKSSRRGVSAGSIAGAINSDGYIVIRIYRVLYYGHRLASSSQNKCNARKRSDNMSGFKGVHLHKPGRWRARIKLNGSITEVGLFSSPEEANSARLLVLGTIHGEFARAA